MLTSSSIARINIVKMLVPPNEICKIYYFREIPVNRKVD